MSDMVTRSTEPPPTPKTVPSDALLLFLVCLFLLAVIAVFILVRLPRLLALLMSSSEWREGYVLRQVSVANPSGRVTQGGVRSVQPEEESKERFHGSDFLHGLHSSRSLRMKDRGTTSHRHPPPHIPSCRKELRPFLRSMRARISPGFSFGQFLLLSAYFGVLTFAACYNSNLFLDLSRMAWIAVSQLPFIFAFAQKSSFLGALFGVGYEKVGVIYDLAMIKNLLTFSAQLLASVCWTDGRVFS